MTGSASYLYAVARPHAADPSWLAGIAGLDGEPVRAVGRDGVLGIVSSVGLDEFDEGPLREHLADLDWLAQTARVHHTVVRAVFERAVTAPLRMATVFRDDDAVRDRLDHWHRTAASLLDGLAGRQEWGVKAYLDAPRPAGDQARERAAVGSGTAAAGPGAAYLTERRREMQERAEQEQAARQRVEQLYLTLAGLAGGAYRHPPQDARLSGHPGVMLLNAAFLVEIGHAADLDRAARQADAELAGVSMELTGPWPPYSFARLEEP